MVEKLFVNALINKIEKMSLKIQLANIESQKVDVDERLRESLTRSLRGVQRFVFVLAKTDETPAAPLTSGSRSTGLTGASGPP